MAFFIGPVHCRVCRVLDHRCAHAVYASPPRKYSHGVCHARSQYGGRHFGKEKSLSKRHLETHSVHNIYNTFLAIYVGGGGRSISGKLPYWYAQYDQPIGWVFAALAVAATGITHFIIAVPEPTQISKQYIV